MKQKILAMAFALASLTLPAAAQEYTLRPGDQLNIVVVQEQEISSNLQNSKETPYTVRPDGTVSFPLVGEIQASGMTVDQFTQYLRNGLSRYYVEPDVTVNIVQLGGIRVHVFGEVKKPGTYELTKSHTIMDALGASGGFTWDAAKKKVFDPPGRYQQGHQDQLEQHAEDRQPEGQPGTEGRGHPVPDQERPDRLCPGYRTVPQRCLHDLGNP